MTEQAYETMLQDVSGTRLGRCWNCGRQPHHRPDNWFADFCLERCHIGSGGGQQYREDDRRAVVILCSWCHNRHTSDMDRFPEKRLCGKLVKTIDWSILLWLKRTMDESWFDWQYLRRVFTQYPPDERPRHHEDEQSFQRLLWK